MKVTVYVGNLPYRTTNEALQQLFGEHGEVTNVNIISDRETGRSKGFGFIDFVQQSDAESAISALDGKEFEGRALKVNLARPPKTGGRH